MIFHVYRSPFVNVTPIGRNGMPNQVVAVNDQSILGEVYEDLECQGYKVVRELADPSDSNCRHLIINPIKPFSLEGGVQHA